MLRLCFSWHKTIHLENLAGKELVGFSERITTSEKNKESIYPLAIFPSILPVDRYRSIVPNPVYRIYFLY